MRISWTFRLIFLYFVYRTVIAFLACVLLFSLIVDYFLAYVSAMFEFFFVSTEYAMAKNNHHSNFES